MSSQNTVIVLLTRDLVNGNLVQGFDLIRVGGGVYAADPAKHTHRFSIADGDAVQMLLQKLGAPNGSRNVDGEKLYKAFDSASRRYNQSNQEISQAFFHGLLTGYAVGLKHK